MSWNKNLYKCTDFLYYMQFLAPHSNRIFTFGLTKSIAMRLSIYNRRILLFCLLLITPWLLPPGVFGMHEGADIEDDATMLEAGAGFEFVTRYHWRGMMLSDGPAVQPFIEISAGGFSAGLWGSSTLQAFAWQETDIYLSYSWNSFTLSLVDYFYHDVTANEPTFFNYRKNSTGHVIEGIAEFSGNDKVPFRILAGYNIYGADPSHSAYFELAWMKTLSETDIEVFAGVTPHTGYYHETKKGLTNVGISMQRYLLKSDHVNVPLKVSAVYSPLNKHVFLVAGLGIF